MNWWLGFAKTCVIHWLAGDLSLFEFWGNQYTLTGAACDWHEVWIVLRLVSDIFHTSIVGDM